MPPELPSRGHRRRARDLGIHLGRLPTGPWNAITDVSGVLVGHSTIIHGHGALRVGQGPVRTGVTVVLPHADGVHGDPVFAGAHVFNGNGELTGLAWLDESGLLTSPVAITNTHSVGVVRDALVGLAVARGLEPGYAWSLPVVAETYDGTLNDINGMHVRAEHVAAAIDAAGSGPVAEGNVGGGTGMLCHQFKGGIGTASRRTSAAADAWIVGALVQANYGRRDLLRIDGVPVGAEIGLNRVPAPGPTPAAPPGSGSIIVVLATDAPLLPTQCRRLAQRATVGLARVGGIGADSSGDMSVAFSTGNRRLRAVAADGTVGLRMLPHPSLTELFEAAAEATEEAIVNALCQAETMVGINGVVAHALPLDDLRAVMHRYGRRLS